MDTREVAEALGTTPKVLRQFLRSAVSTFTAVGSNARYDFSETDVRAMAPRFARWASGKKNAVTGPVVVQSKPNATTTRTHADKDQAVWDEEGPVKLPDIRDPRVLAEVRRAEADRVARLEERLLAAGLHISQWADAPVVRHVA